MVIKKSDTSNPWEQDFMTKMITKHIQYGFPEKNVSSSMLRNIIITHYNKNHIFASQLPNWARLCGHGVQTNLDHYTHNFEEEEN